MRIFDMMNLPGKPHPTMPGLRPLKLATFSWMFRRVGSHYDVEGPDEAKIRRNARKTDSLLCLDPETSSARTVMEICRIVHDERPDLMMGVYHPGLLPRRAYWAIRRYEKQLKLPNASRSDDWPGYRQAIKDWWSEGLANRRGDRPLIKHVSVMFPSLYTVKPNVGPWVDFARRMIRESRKYDMPVYPCIWPLYHSRREYEGTKWVSTDFWRTQLEVCREEADGCVVAHFRPDSSDWSDQEVQDRWLITKEFSS